MEGHLSLNLLVSCWTGRCACFFTHAHQPRFARAFSYRGGLSPSFPFSDTLFDNPPEFSGLRQLVGLRSPVCGLPEAPRLAWPLLVFATFLRLADSEAAGCEPFLADVTSFCIIGAFFPFGALTLFGSALPTSMVVSAICTELLQT